MSKRHFVIIDTETTGLVEPDPIEIGFIHINKGREDFINRDRLTSPDDYPTYCQRFLPNKEIDPRASAVNGIFIKDLVGMPNCDSFNLHDKVLGEGRRDETIIMCMSNVSYDYRVLKKPENVVLLDTKQLTKIAYPGDKSHALLSLATTHLDASLNHYLKDAHTALGDCWLVYFLLLELLQNSNLPVETFPEFGD